MAEGTVGVGRKVDALAAEMREGFAALDRRVLRVEARLAVLDRPR